MKVSDPMMQHVHCHRAISSVGKCGRTSEKRPTRMLADFKRLGINFKFVVYLRIRELGVLFQLLLLGFILRRFHSCQQLLQRHRILLHLKRLLPRQSVSVAFATSNSAIRFLRSSTLSCEVVVLLRTLAVSARFGKFHLELEAVVLLRTLAVSARWLTHTRVRPQQAALSGPRPP